MRVRFLAPLLLLLLPGPGSTSPSSPEVIETFRAPVSGFEMTVLRDVATGEKWIEDPDGRRYADLDAVWFEEGRRLGNPRSRMAPALRDLLDDPDEADEPVPVVLVLREQPLHAAATELKPALRRDVAEIMAPARRIWARIESRLPPRAERARLDIAEQHRQETRAMTSAEATIVRGAVRTTRERIRRFRGEAIAQAVPRCEASRRPVLARLPGVEIAGSSDLLNAIFVTVAPSRLPGLLVASPEIWAALPVLTYHADLDKSVPTIGASSFWTGGYTGSGTSVGVLDSGMDNQHPSIKSAITNESVFLTYGKTASKFNDDATKTDDLHGHGTHVGGTAAGQDSTYTGVAKAASLVNAKCFYRTTDTPPKASADSRDIFYATAWAISRADVLNLSFGGSGGNGDSALSRLYDAVVHDLGVAVVAAAGNTGSSSGTIESPGDAYNVITAGAANDKNTTSTSDDALASFSSRGPTSDGRRKPTIAAPGYLIKAPNYAWETAANFVDLSGTSMATPHVAGAVAVILDYKSSYTPQAVKALLVNTSLNTSPYPTSPDNKWGWGGLDLAAAYSARGDVLEDSVESSGAESLFFIRTSSLAGGDRATLVWNKHVTYSSSSWPGTPPSLTDLDLYLYDGSTGSEKVKSISSVNPVEQVKAGGTVVSPVLRVHRSGSFASGVTEEPFALAHPSGFSLADPPTLTSSFTTLPTTVGPAAVFDVTVTVSNTGDLAAISPSVTLTLPSGWSLQSGTNPRTISTIAASGSGTATFSVKAPSTTQSGTFKAKAESTSFGEDFASAEVSGTQQVDATAPSGSVTIAGGDAWTTSSTVTLTLTATDAHSGVSRMRFSNDGSTYGSWESYGTSKSWTLTSGEGTRTVYVQYDDAVGNVSAAASDTISVDSTAPTGSLVIDSGAAWTVSASVTLGVTSADGGSGVTDMRFSDDGSSWSTWETAGSSKSWTLPTGDGSKTVYLQLRDAAGNVSESFTDTIGLDSTAPTGTLEIAWGAAWTGSASVTLGVTSADAGSGVTDMRFSDDGSSWSAWETAGSSKSWTLPTGDGTRTVYLQLRDAAGNVSTAVSDGIGLDTTGPTASLVIAGGDAWTTSLSVTLGVTSADAGSGVADMRFSDDGSTWSAWETAGATKSWTLPTGDGTKTVHLQVRDAAGNESSPTTDTIIVDTTAPAGTPEIAAGATWTATTSVSIGVTSSDAGSGVADMRFSDDGSTWSTWETAAGSKSWTLPTGDGSKTVYLQLRDAAGNVSASFTDTIGLDSTAPTGTLEIAGGAAWTSSTAVSLGVTSSDGGSGVADMRFSDDGSSWSTWETAGSSKAWTLPTGDGGKTVYAQFRDAAGNVSTAVSDGIGLDTTGPTASLVIAGGDAWTTSLSVTLGVTSADAGSGVADMRFSDDGSTWSAWETAGATKSWTLPTGDGTKTVHLQVRDAAGNESSPTTDTIIVDTTAPAGTPEIAAGATWTATTSVSIGVTSSDAGSGVADMRFSDDGSTWSTWETAAGSKSWTLPTGDGSKTVYLQLRDAAGNVSASFTDTIGLDSTAPTGTLEIAGGAAWTSSTAVSLGVTSSDGGSGVADMRFSDDGSSWSAWETAGSSKSWTLPTGDGTRTVYLQLRDAAGNVSTAVSDGIGLDTTGPTASLVIAGGDAWTTSLSVTLGVTSADAGSGVADMRFSDDGSTWSAWETAGATKSWTLPTGDGTKTVHLQVRDAAGNESSPTTDTIIVDTTAPAGTPEIAAGATWTATTSVSIGVTSSDAGSGVADMRFSDDGSTWSTWETAAGSKSWTLPTGDGSKTVYLQLRDAAGNVSASFTDTIGLDSTAPTGTLEISGGAAWTGSASVTLGVTSADAGSGVTDMRFSDDGSSWSAWETAGSSKAWTLPTGDGARTVYLQLRDAAGNVSTAVSDGIGLDTTGPTASLVIAGGDAWTTSLSVTLGVTSADAGSGVADMRFSDDGSSWSAWETAGATKSWTLPTGDGTKTVHLQVRDAAGNESSPTTDTIIVDTTAPAGTPEIAAGATWTATTSVSIGVTSSDAGSGVTDMRFSDDGSTWTTWEPAGSTKSWTLPTGDGTKTVHLQVRDAAGNESSVTTDTILVDTTAPAGTPEIAAGATWTATTSVSIGVTSSDAGSGVADMRFSDDGSSWSAWETAGSSKAWTLPTGDGARTVYLQLRDAAGNVSTAVNDGIGLDTTGPTASLVIAGGDAWTTSLSVTLGVTSADAGSGVADMRFSDDGSTWSAWETAGATKSWTLPAGDETKTVHLQVRDAAGNESSPTTDTIIVDTTAPAGTPEIAAGATWTATTSVSIGVTSSDAGSGVTDMRFSDDGSTWTTWEPAGSTKSWTLPTGDGTKTVHLQVRDAAGNESSVTTDTILVDTTAPAGTPEIAAGATWTATTSVSIGVTSSDAGSGVADMRFSDDGSSWSAWETAGSSKAWTLPTGDGARTVYLQLRDAAGNVSTAVSDGIGLDTTGPTASLVISGGDAWTTSLSVTLGVTSADAGSGVADMRFSDDGSSWSAWETAGATKSWTLPAGDETKTVHLQVRDAAGNESSPTTDTIIVDTTAPAGTPEIAAGATWTATTSVSIGVTSSDAGSGVADMRFSDDGSSWSTWETAGSSKSWTLPTGDGSKTVYLQLRDAAGNVSESFTDTIGLDSTVPTGTLEIAGGAAWTGSASVTLGVTSADAGSGVADMRFSDDGSTWSTWETAGSSKAWTLPTGDGTRTVYLQLRDAAGNVSTAVSDGIGLDTTGPTASLVIAGGDAWTTSLSATLGVTSADAGSGVADMRFSDDGSSWSAWETAGATKSWTLPTGDGTKTVHMQVRDAAGNESSPTTDTIIVDTTAPAGTPEIAAGATWTATTSVSIAVTSSDAGSGVADMRFSDDGATWSTWETAAGSKAWTLPTGDGSKTVYLQLRDAAGNVSSAVNDTIGLDTTAPTGHVLLASGATWTSSTDVGLDLDAEDDFSGVAAMRLSDDGANWGPWTGYADSADWSIGGSDGTKRAYAQFRDAAGNVSPMATDTVGLDRTAPAGSVLVDGGNSWTRSTAVTLSLTASDPASGVADMSFSTDGATWTAWKSFAASDSVVLPAGTGTRTVRARYRDAAGNVSTTASDSIVLDTTPPTGTLTLEGGWPATNSLSVTFAVSASDAHSGVAHVRFSVDGTTWQAWTGFSSSGSVVVPAGEGTKTVRVMLRDGAGNESGAIGANILLDETAPSGTFVANDAAPYVMPGEDIVFDVEAIDESGGSGIRDFKTSLDGGSTWSGWISLEAGSRVVVERPNRESALTASVVVRDVAGNESAVTTRPIHLVTSSPSAPGPKSKFAGTLSSPRDVDVFAIDVARGDTLSLKLKVKSDVDGQDVVAAFDVVREDGTRVAESRPTVPTKKLRISGLVAPASARYYLVIHRTGGGASTGTYTLKTKVKQARSNKKAKGDLVGGVVRFEAAEDGTVKATLKGDGITAAGVELAGPDGPVAFASEEKDGQVKIRATVLSAGTGAYEIRVSGVIDGSYKVSVKPEPKAPSTVTE